MDSCTTQACFSDPWCHCIIRDSVDPLEIIEKLGGFFGKSIIPGKTLLFFDEIQACPNAIRSLRYFHEKLPELHTAAAGSLLEFAISEIPSFGIGRIHSLYMQPMNFEEFLEACGFSELARLINEATPTKPLDEPLHDRAIDKLRTFMITGGMPAVVSIYVQKHDLTACQEALDDLISTFEDDFAKYRKKIPAAKLSDVFKSVALQSGCKFKYSKISDIRYPSGYKKAFDLLVKAGLVHKIHHTHARGVPLGAQASPQKFKAIIFDLGIFQRLLGLDLSEHLVSDHVSLVNKGALAEVHAGLEFLASGAKNLRPEIHYWHREAKSSNAEVDYVLSINGKIIPIEVKAGFQGQMQSLGIFIEERHLKSGIKISFENFSVAGKITNIPLYAAAGIRKLI